MRGVHSTPSELNESCTQKLKDVCTQKLKDVCEEVSKWAKSVDAEQVHEAATLLHCTYKLVQVFLEC